MATSVPIPGMTAGTPQSTDQMYVDRAASNVTITNVALASNVATITTSTSHGLVVNQWIRNLGLTNTQFNGTWMVTGVPTSNTFTFALVSGNVSSTADSGTNYVFTDLQSTLGTLAANFPATTVTLLSLATTPTDAFFGQNTTAAAASAQQVSPAIEQSGQGWATGSGGSSQAVNFRSFVQPVQGTTNPTGNLVWQSNVNGAGYVNCFALTNILGGTGYMVAGGNSTNACLWSNQVTPTSTNFGLELSSSAAILNGPSGGAAYLGIGSSLYATLTTSSFALIVPAQVTIASLGTSPTDAFRLYNTTAAANGAQQYSPLAHWQAQGFGTTGGTSQSIDFTVGVTATQGTVPTGSMVWQSQVAGGGYSTIASLTTGGQWLMPGGSTAAPTFSFAAEPTTGVFQRGASALIDFCFGGVLAVEMNSSYVGILSTGQFTWANSSSTAGSIQDTGMSRLAASVIGTTNGGTGAGWLQNTGGEAALNSNFTNANATLTATNISFTVIAGRKYRIQGYLIVSNSLAADGAQFDFNGGSATATTFDVAFNNLGSNVAGTTTGTALNSVINYTTTTGTDRIFVEGYLKVNAAGTIVLRAAGNTDVSGTMTLAAGSWIALSDTVTM